MSFMDKLKEVSTTGLTQNGAVTYTSSLNANVDFFAQAGAMRNKGTSVVANLFGDAFREDQVTAILNLIHLRNVRMGGLGERKSFYSAMKYLVDNNETYLIKLFASMSPEMGRWDDVFKILQMCLVAKNKEAVKHIVEMTHKQFDSDLRLADSDVSISLLGKWIPSPNAKNAERRALGGFLFKEFNKIAPLQIPNISRFRKLITILRAKINIIETHIAGKNYDRIDFTKTPSKALFKYRGFFYREMSSEYQQFLNRVKSGEVELKASLVMPNEIVRSYTLGSYGTVKYNQALELTWDSLADNFEKTNMDMIVVADTSGSMSGQPADVALGLSLYTSERLRGGFMDKVITFSRNAKFIDFTNCKNLCDKINLYRRLNIVEDTNIESVFNLILKTAVEFNMKSEDIPSTILIISDMEFNQGTISNKSMYENAKISFKNYGFELPNIIYWNVNAYGSNLPVRYNEQGTALVSGFSTNVLRSIMEGKDMTPLAVMNNTLRSQKYLDFLGKYTQ